MEPWQMWAAGIVLGVIAGAFRHTHVRINQVRQEAIDIADRNSENLKEIALESKKDTRKMNDFLREDFGNRAVDLKGSFEQLRRESREDLKDQSEGNNKFRDEVRHRLDEILREVRNGHKV